MAAEVSILKAMIERLQGVSPKQWDMMEWCGTAKCAAGHCQDILGLVQDSMSLWHPGSGTYGSEALGIVTGLTQEEVLDVFYSGSYPCESKDITPQMVIDRITLLVEKYSGTTEADAGETPDR